MGIIKEKIEKRERLIVSHKSHNVLGVFLLMLLFVVFVSSGTSYFG